MAPLSLVALVLGLGMASVAAAAADPAETLANARGHQRALVVFAPGQAALQAQTKLWRGAEKAFAERDVVVIPCLADDPAARPLAARYHVGATKFCVILFGKDGRDARRYARPVPAAAINDAIDSMPMRQAEMRRPERSPSSRPAR